MGESLTLTAPAVEGVNQLTTYTWTGGNVANLATTNANVLRFNTLGINDFGTYKLEVTTGSGITVTSNEITINSYTIR